MALLFRDQVALPPAGNKQELGKICPGRDSALTPEPGEPRVTGSAGHSSAVLGGAWKAALPPRVGSHPQRLPTL